MSSIRSILEDLVLNVVEANSLQGGDGDMDKRNYAYDQALKEISELIDEAKPKKAYTGFNGSYVSGIDQYQSNLREALL